MQRDQKRLPPILLVEDDPDALFMFERAAERVGMNHRIHLARDGQQAIAYFMQALGHGETLPAVTLLDLSMPHRSGFDVLRWIRSRPLLGDAPVIVFSGSRRPEDVTLAYDLGADGWLDKPNTLPELVETVELVAERWLPGTAASRPAA